MERRIAYISSRYPVLREAFIIREVLALERAGLEVSVFSLKKPHKDLVNRDLDEISGEVYWTPHLFHGPLIRDNLATLLRSPVSYLITPLRSAWPVRGYPLQALKYVALYPKMIHYGREIQRRGIRGINSCWASIPTLAASIAKQFFGIPYCMTCRAWDIFVPMNQTDLARKVSSAVAIRTNNFNGARCMHQFCETTEDLEKIRTVYNPFDVRGISPRAGLPDGPPVIMAGGSLTEQKGLTYLLDAVARLKNRGRDVHVQLVGEGPEETSLRNQVSRLGIEDQVRFLGTMPNHRFLENMRDSHLFVLPSVPTTKGQMDGIPNVLIESMALGVPVISTTISGIPELIEDGVSGLLAPPRDVPVLATAIGRLLDDRDLQETFGRNGRAKVESLFEMSNNAHQLIEIYRSGGLL